MTAAASFGTGRLQMNKSKSRPSPAIIFAVVALAFSLVGTAVAANDGLYPKLTKSKVKSIAKKQATKQLKANVNNSHVNLADKATDADNLGGVPAANYAMAYAEISDTGSIKPAPPNANIDAVTRPDRPLLCGCLVHACIRQRERHRGVQQRDGGHGGHTGHQLRGISAGRRCLRLCVECGRRVVERRLHRPVRCGLIGG